MNDGIVTTPFTGSVLAIAKQGQALGLIRSALKPYGKDANAFLAGIALYIDQSIANAKGKSIADCSTESVVDSVRQWADTGLSVNGALQHAHIVPFGNKATFVVGWKGLIALMLRSGAFDTVETHLAYPGETFRVTRGTSPSIVHEPNLDNDGGENWVAVYAVGFKGKRSQFVCWSRGHMEKFADKLRMKGPLWRSDFTAMARKTMVRRLADLVDIDGSPTLTRLLPRDDAAEMGETIPERVETATVAPKTQTDRLAAMVGVEATEPKLPPALAAARAKYRKDGVIEGDWNDEDMRVIVG